MNGLLVGPIGCSHLYSPWVFPGSGKKRMLANECQNPSPVKKMAGAEPSPVKRSSRRGVGRGASGRDDDGLSEYERHRLSRIRENQARLEALGLRNLASALRGPSSSVGQGQATGETKTDSGILGRRRRGKNDDDEGDDDYQPSEEDEGGEGFLSSEEEAEEEGQTPKRKVRDIFS